MANNDDQGKDANTRIDDLADTLWADEATRAWVADHLEINGGNYWLFKVGLKSTIIRFGGLDDQDYFDSFLEDVNDQMRGGSIRQRDNWFEWQGKEFAPFRRWVHREKKPNLSPVEKRTPFTRPQIERWWEEWDDMSDGKKATYEIEEPID